MQEGRFFICLGFFMSRRDILSITPHKAVGRSVGSKDLTTSANFLLGKER